MLNWIGYLYPKTGLINKLYKLEIYMPVKKDGSVTKTKKVPAPLLLEPHPRDYTGLPFLTLIQYRKHPVLTIVDNVDSQTLKVYVLDLCGPEGVDEETMVIAAADWYENNRFNYPISVEFSKRGMTADVSRVYKSFNVEFVSRVIGPVSKFPMVAIKSVKRRRRKTVPPGVEINNILQIDQFFK